MSESEMISFIILTYRNFNGIYDTLDSLFLQDYPSIELIISDDGSPNAGEVFPEIEAYIETHKRENIRKVTVFQSKENQGTVRNANRAYRAAEGKYIKVLGAEDTLRDSHTLTDFKEFLDASGCLLCFSKIQGITENGELRNNLASCENDYDLLRSYTPEQLRNRLFRRNCLPAPGFFAKKELFETYGYFREDLRLIEDYPYWLELCRQGVPFAFLDEKLINYRLSGVSSSGHYGMAFMKDMLTLYDRYIFPYDRRFGILQPVYNQLKRAGLNTYVAKAEWSGYSTAKKIRTGLCYFPFFVFIRINDWIHSK